MAKEVKLLPTRHHKDSLIVNFLKQLDKKSSLGDSLVETDWLRQKGESCRDLYGHNTLLKCFQEDRVTTSRILVTHFIELNKSVST